MTEAKTEYQISLQDGGGVNGIALTVVEASVWASRKTGRTVTPSNITYLVKYGRIPSIGRNGGLMVSTTDLEDYYRSRAGSNENTYKRRLGNDLNWHLSFEEFKESETTKHVHRLHPYKGKFIPQLVEYFLDGHTDEFKNDTCFAPGDIVLDPFCGSGTTLVQANELGMHAVGVDVSLFNAMISNLKLCRVPLWALREAASEVSNAIASNSVGQRARAFEDELLQELKKFNTEFFPSPTFRRKVMGGEIDEDRYGEEREGAFRRLFLELLQKHGVNNGIGASDARFMNNWYLQPVKSEIDTAKDRIDQISDVALRDTLRLILSRTVRSSRATTHSDLATLVRQVTETYYCSKHSKVCKPLFSMLGWWRRYAEDTVKRKSQFENLRTDTMQTCLTGDSREIDIPSALDAVDGGLSELVRQRGIRGIFTSPPYVGMIDYHEQHAYAYDLFGLPRNDDSEIGPMSAGRGRQARESYVDGVAQVLSNGKKYLVDDFDVFIVANDKFGLYSSIAERSGMTIYKEYKRPVLNRAEGDKGAYAETIFHMKRQ